MKNNLVKHVSSIHKRMAWALIADFTFLSTSQQVQYYKDMEYATIKPLYHVYNVRLIILLSHILQFCQQFSQHEIRQILNMGPKKLKSHTLPSNNNDTVQT